MRYDKDSQEYWADVAVQLAAGLAERITSRSVLTGLNLESLTTLTDLARELATALERVQELSNDW